MHKRESVRKEIDMAGRVTIQDIADALGLSRNTVSKAINNTGILADATKEKILLKAMEMGYKTFSYAGSQAGVWSGFSNTVVPAADHQKREIALFTGMFLDNSHFASTMLDKFQYELSSLGYSMTIHRILPNDFEQQKLPLSFHMENTAAIVCVEIFHHPYCQMLCRLGLPVLFIDAPISTYADPLPADLLLMENASGIYRIVKTAASNGITKIGFVGQPTHCRSFYERYMAFREARYLYSLPVNDSYCLTEVHPHGTEYRSYLKDHLKKMKNLPELFICANDFVAIDLMVILREMGISCPEDILISGFDDSPESKVVSPPLTTIHIHSQIIGLCAAQVLIGRIMQPDLNFRTVHTETDLIYRESTRGAFNNAKSI